jgi:AcrR family transcriptional regulator
LTQLPIAVLLEKMTKKTNAEPAPHRRATACGYARGQETRLRIIEAALELFGAHGYEQTSTRDIATRAGVNTPALQYYFDGKDGLYIACAEHMAERAHSLLVPALEKVRTALAGKPDSDALIECVWTLMEQVADTMLLSEEVEAWARFMAWDDLRQDESRGGVQAVLERCFRHEINLLLRTLIGRITGRKPGDTQTRIRAVTLMAQITIFFGMREHVLEKFGWTELDEAKLKTLKTIIRGQTVAALKAAAKA